CRDSNRPHHHRLIRVQNGSATDTHRYLAHTLESPFLSETSEHHQPFHPGKRFADAHLGSATKREISKFGDIDILPAFRLEVFGPFEIFGISLCDVRADEDAFSPSHLITGKLKTCFRASCKHQYRRIQAHCLLEHVRRIRQPGNVIQSESASPKNLFYFA